MRSEEESVLKVVKKFMECWKNREWSDMFRYTQKTWQSKEGNWPPLLMGWFGPKELVTYKIVKEKKISSTCIDVFIKVSYFFGPELRKSNTIARVICELSPYRPSIEGEWGVNPVGVLRGFAKDLFIA